MGHESGCGSSHVRKNPKALNSQIPKALNYQIPKALNCQSPKFPNPQSPEFPNPQSPELPNPQGSKSIVEGPTHSPVTIEQHAKETPIPESRGREVHEELGIGMVGVGNW